MSSFLHIDELPEREVQPGMRARIAHGRGMTIAWWEIDDGAVLPEHAHPHEQIVSVIEGRVELTLGGETRVLDAGSVVLIPSNVPHSGRALARCRVIDVWHPVRDDLR